MVQILKVGEKWMKGPRAIKMEAVRFFKSLYTQPMEHHVDISGGLLPSLSSDMAVELEYHVKVINLYISISN